MRKFTRSTPLIALFAFHLKFDVLRGAKRNRLLIYSVTVLLTEPFSSRLRAAFCLLSNCPQFIRMFITALPAASR